jgi:copper(I)-binding protein
LVINQPWVSYKSAAHSADVFMDITSSNDAALTNASSATVASATLSAAGRAPRKVNRIDLPAHAMVRLAPGKQRIVLRGIKPALKLGDYVTLVLTIENGDGTRLDIPVHAEVRHHSPLDDERREHQHPHQ